MNGGSTEMDWEGNVVVKDEGTRLCTLSVKCRSIASKAKSSQRGH